MLTPYGKAVRKHRIDAGLTLRQMAKKLSVSPAFLSATETGRKDVPIPLIEKISDLLGLDQQERVALQAAAETSRRAIKVELGNRAAHGDREVAAMFARQFPGLSEAEKEQIRRILEDAKK
jgi:transcriptional regulator with XRE-family HTH domain